MRKNFRHARTWLAVSLVPGALLVCGQAHAAAFALLEQSANRLGTAFAGTAVGQDVTAMFFNPAALANLDSSEFAVVLSGIKVSSEFRNFGGSNAASLQALGTNGGDAGGWNAVPVAYGAFKISDPLTFGIGVNVPFGLKLDYASDWIGRYQALKSEIQTINVNPALSWQIAENFVFGIGLNYQKMQAELTNATNYSAAIAAASSGAVVVPGLEGHTRLRGDDSDTGWNAGFQLLPTPTTRIGFGYRSAMEYRVEGSVVFTPPTTSGTNPALDGVIAALSQPGAPFQSGAATVKLKLPDSATFSVAQQIGTVELSADVAWTNWSTVQELRVLRPTGELVSNTPELWRDTWRVALGASVALNDAWTVRAGVAHDESPVPNSTRTARLPDAERTWAAVGFQWKTQSWTVDAGYAHLFSDDVRLDQDDSNSSLFALLNGQQASSVDIVSVQLSYRF